MIPRNVPAHPHPSPHQNRHHTHPPKQDVEKSIRDITAICSIALLGSCTSLNAPKGDNSSRAQFLDEVWVSPKVRGKASHELFTKVYLAPVTTGNLQKQGWWSSQNAIKQDQLAADSRKLAGSFHQSLVTAARNDPSRRLTVVNQPGPGTLTVEMAITELVPAKAYWNAAATTAGFVIPGAGLLGAAGAGSIAIEGRMRDGNNNQVIATFRDQMTDKMAVVNVDSYSWYGGSQANLKEIAAKTARVLNADAGEVVTQSSPIKMVAH